MPGKFKVYITRYAYSQLKEIRQYIAEELFIPDTAKKLLLNIREAIGSLQSMPFRHQLVDEEPWKTEGVRRVIVKNFYVYYWTNEEKEEVHVTAVVYGRRDQVKQLEEMDMG